MARRRVYSPLASRAERAGEASRSCPDSCTSEARCLALVSEASNDTVSPRLASPRLARVLYCMPRCEPTCKYTAGGPIHAFCTLRVANGYRVASGCRVANGPRPRHVTKRRHVAAAQRHSPPWVTGRVSRTAAAVRRHQRLPCTPFGFNLRC